MSRLIHSILNTITILLVIIIFTPGSAQIIKSHEIGMLWETMFPTGSMPRYAPLQHQMTYPGGDFSTFTMRNLMGRGLWIGATDWTDTLGTFHSRYVSEGGFENFDAPEFTRAISNRKHVRNLLPVVTVNGKVETRYVDNRQASLPGPTMPADERIETKWATNVGVEVRMRSFALANQNHNSYIIREYQFTNTGDAKGDGTPDLPGQNLTGVYFGFQYYLIPGGDRGHQLVNQHDDWAAYYGNQPGDTLRGLFYMFDGRADDNHYQGDDTGDPETTIGEFLSPQYPAYGVLHADQAYNDDSDDRNQPATVDIKPRRVHRSYSKGNSELELYLELSSGTQSIGTAHLQGTLNPYDQQVIEPVILMAFGPYDIPYNESITIVLYEAVGSISRRLAISAGREWLDGTLEFEGKTGDEAKNALLATGKDSLFMHASRAQYAWSIGLNNLPTPPPAPDEVTITSGPGKIELEWESVAQKKDWQTKELDFAGYRIYRTEGTYTNVYNFIADLPGTPEEDITTYTDRGVERGKKYYYNVTAYDNGSQNTTGILYGQSLESSRFSTRNYDVGATPFLGASKNLDSVYVVPNPYHIQGLSYGGTIIEDYKQVPRIEEKIAFVGLPPIATIRIFTMHGDLLVTIPHPNPTNPNSIPDSADEEWFQITEQWQNIKSGVYIYYVEGWELDGTPLGTTTGKFVIIR